jgi:hypothetical protein
MKNLLPLILFLSGMALHAQSQPPVNGGSAHNAFFAKAAARTQGSNNDLPYRFTHYIYDTARQIYIWDYRQLFTYDNNGNTIQLEEQVNKKDSAVDSIRYLYTYSSDGLNFTQITQTVDPYNNVWINKQRDTISTNIHGDEVYNGSYRWANEAWQSMNSSRMEYVYDQAGHTIETTFFYRSNGNSAWQLNQKDSCVLDANGKVRRRLIYIPATNGTLTLSQNFFYYDVLNNNIRQPLYDSVEYSYPSGSYKVVDSFAYNTDGMMTTHVQRRLINGIWTKTEEVICTYNSHHMRSKYITIDRAFSGSLDTSFVIADSLLYDDQDREIVDLNSMKYNGIITLNKVIWEYDNKEGLDAKSLQAGLFTVYPNPSKDILHVVLNSAQAAQAVLSLYDMQGRKVWSAVSPQMITDIAVVDLPSGVYQLRMECTGQVQYTKVVKY